MKKRSLFILKIAVSAILIYLITSKIDWNQLIISFGQGDYVYLSIGVLVGFVFNCVKFAKWHYLINAGIHTYSFWDGAKSYMFGNALGLVTPLRAGDLGRALYFPKNDRTRILGLTIIDRAMDVVAILMLSIGGSFTLIKREFGLLVLLSCALSILVLYSPGIFQSLLNRTIKAGKIIEKVNKLIGILKILDTRTITTCLIMSVIAFIITIIEFYYVISAFEEITLSSTALVTPLITLSVLVPITFMGLGVREGLSIMLFSMFGISSGTALSAAFLCFAINNVSISLIGAGYLSKIELPNQDAKIGSASLTTVKNEAKGRDSNQDLN